MNSIMFLYVMRAGILYKIGVANNPNKRKYNIQSEIGRPVELVRTYVLRDAPSAEWQLHQTFSDKRVHGEWFCLNPSDLVAIDDFCRPETIGTIPDPDRKPEIVKVRRKKDEWFAVSYPMLDGADLYDWIGLVASDGHCILPPAPYRDEITEKLRMLGLSVSPQGGQP